MFGDVNERNLILSHHSVRGRSQFSFIISQILYKNTLYSYFRRFASKESEEEIYMSNCKKILKKKKGRKAMDERRAPETRG